MPLEQGGARVLGADGHGFVCVLHGVAPVRFGVFIYGFGVSLRFVVLLFFYFLFIYCVVRVLVCWC